MDRALVGTNSSGNTNGATHLLLTQRHGGHKEKDEHRLRSLTVTSVPYSLSLTFRLSAVDLAVPLKGIGAEKLRLESRRANLNGI